MTLKIYCDTNIFLDYLEQRSDNIRPLYEFAYLFFSKGWNCHFNIVVSDWLMEELKRHQTDEKIEEVLGEFKKKNKVIFVKREKSDMDKARSMGDNWDDALHAVLAKKADADFLVTRNLRHYVGCETLVRVVLPEFI